VYKYLAMHGWAIRFKGLHTALAASLGPAMESSREQVMRVVKQVVEERRRGQAAAATAAGEATVPAAAAAAHGGTALGNGADAARAFAPEPVAV
jgi:hypothetical protein